MYKSRTTFIVGAGASLELGFPTSATLKQLIAEAVDVGFEHFSRQIRGDRSIAEALRQHADYHQEEQVGEYNLHIEAGWHIAKAMPQAISIDNFVENQEDGRVSRMAKLGIASCLIDAERNCFHTHFGGDRDEDPDWRSFQNNWIHKLFQTLSEGTTKSAIEGIFENITFVVFNYDRSLEFFLSKCIKNYYDIGADHAHQIVNSARFFHPYGQIGKLPWQHSELPELPFGCGRKDNLYPISQSLLTFSEQVEDADTLDQIRNAVHDAEQIIFLGFGFHESNLKLLQPHRTADTGRVIATAFGISKPDCDVILDQLSTLCLTDFETLSFQMEGALPLAIDDRSEGFIVDNQATSSSLFETYRRLLLS